MSRWTEDGTGVHRMSKPSARARPTSTFCEISQNAGSTSADCLCNRSYHVLDFLPSLELHLGCVLARYIVELVAQDDGRQSIHCHQKAEVLTAESDISEADRQG